MKLKSLLMIIFHKVIPEYIEDNDITIKDIDTMIDAYMRMVKDNYLFLIDRDLLKDLLVEITYMYASNDDADKDQCPLSFSWFDSAEDDDDEEVECEEINTD